MASRAEHKSLLFHPLPPTVYFDTNFFVNALIKQESHSYKNLVCRYFINRLIESRAKVYFSAILFLLLFSKHWLSVKARCPMRTRARVVNELLQVHLTHWLCAKLYAYYSVIAAVACLR